MRNKIRELRTKDNLTLEYLAYISNISVGYLCKLELGSKNNPSDLVMQNISTALKKTVEEVFFE